MTVKSKAPSRYDLAAQHEIAVLECLSIHVWKTSHVLAEETGLDIEEVRGALRRQSCSVVSSFRLGFKLREEPEADDDPRFDGAEVDPETYRRERLMSYLKSRGIQFVGVGYHKAAGHYCYWRRWPALKIRVGDYLNVGPFVEVKSIGWVKYAHDRRVEGGPFLRFDSGKKRGYVFTPTEPVLQIIHTPEEDWL